MANKNYENLNVNPCKMCMPMGMVMAFKGIQSSMVLLHGSQGCSTYIRRHMATHYNEPVDVASSSLTEQGTVFGGANNMKSAIYNIMKLYHPKVIGIATTCLAETIGEDIERLARELRKDTSLADVDLIPVSTPGYQGTQFEGYHYTLKKVLQDTCESTQRNDKVNVILPFISPADVRHIKEILDMFELDYILYPDISDTLDSPYSESYRRIPYGGTSILDIRRMSGAKATIEIGKTIPDKLSAGLFLQKQYKVPLYRTGIPMGVSETDELMRILSKISERPIPDKIKHQRGRLLDAMIDSHKYNAEGRAVIYGEPELVYGITNVCNENGVHPLLVATGGQHLLLEKVVEQVSKKHGYKTKVLVEADFSTLQAKTRELNSNILIGNSDGKWIEEKEGISLVRIGFPIHDRIGGQRLLRICYEGTLNFLDDITNTLLESKQSTYRKRMYYRYYKNRKTVKREVK